MNTQKSTLRQDDSDVEEAALNEESTATRGNLRDSESLEDSDTEDFSQSETVSYFEEAQEQAHRSETRRGKRVRNVPQFSEEVRTYPVVSEGDKVYKAKQGDNLDQWHWAMKDEVKALQDNKTWNPVRPRTDRDVIPGKWVCNLKM